MSRQLHAFQLDKYKNAVNEIKNNGFFTRTIDSCYKLVGFIALCKDIIPHFVSFFYARNGESIEACHFIKQLLNFSYSGSLTNTPISDRLCKASAELGMLTMGDADRIQFQRAREVYLQNRENINSDADEAKMIESGLHINPTTVTKFRNFTKSLMWGVFSAVKVGQMV